MIEKLYDIKTDCASRAMSLKKVSTTKIKDLGLEVGNENTNSVFDKQVKDYVT